MANVKLTDKSELVAPAADDLVHVVDIDDTSSDPAGTSKKTTLANAATPIFASKNTDNLGEGATNLYNRVPAGGTTNQVLTKNSGTDYDASWADISGVAKTSPSILIPVHPGLGTGDAGVTGGATLKGGIYKTFESIQFNRVHVNFTTYAATRTLRFLMYQDQDKNGTFEKICTIESFDAGGTGVAVMTPTEDPIILNPGSEIVVLWGNDGTGNIGLSCFTHGNIDLLSSSSVSISGHIPTAFNTTVSSTSSPATVDPTVGGSDGFIGSDASDTLPIIRLSHV